MRRFEYIQATEVAQAAQAGAVLKAGGVDLLGLVKERLLAPDRIVSLLRIDALRQIVAAKDGTRTGEASLLVGALVTLAELAAHAGVAASHGALQAAAAHAATPQVRNQATVGGNLLQRPRCWYFRNPDMKCLKKGGDTCYAQEGENRFHAVFGNDVCAIVHPSNIAPALVALGATVVLVGPGGERQASLEEFLTPPETDIARENALRDGEVLTEVRVPEKGLRSAYLEVRERQTFDWPLVTVAAAVRMDGARVAEASVVAGSVAPVPWRLKDVEAVVKSSALDAAVLAKAAEACVKGARPLAQNGYKLQQLRALVPRALQLAARGA